MVPDCLHVEIPTSNFFNVIDTSKARLYGWEAHGIYTVVIFNNDIH